MSQKQVKKDSIVKTVENEITILLYTLRYNKEMGETVTQYSTKSVTSAAKLLNRKAVANIDVVLPISNSETWHI